MYYIFAININLINEEIQITKQIFYVNRYSMYNKKKLNILQNIVSSFK